MQSISNGDYTWCMSSSSVERNIPGMRCIQLYVQLHSACRAFRPAMALFLLGNRLRLRSYPCILNEGPI